MSLASSSCTPILIILGTEALEFSCAQGVSRAHILRVLELIMDELEQVFFDHNRKLQELESSSRIEKYNELKTLEISTRVLMQVIEPVLVEEKARVEKHGHTVEIKRRFSEKNNQSLAFEVRIKLNEPSSLLFISMAGDSLKVTNQIRGGSDPYESSDTWSPDAVNRDLVRACIASFMRSALDSTLN